MTPQRPRPRRSTESFGLGQSGYTAGRVAGDRALEEQLEDRNIAYPAGSDEAPNELGEDERFTGLGGRPWRPAPG